MSSAEFKAAGLDKLSDEELAALNAWLQQNSASVQPATLDRRGFENLDMKNADDVVARIEGEFTGWTGKTVFALNNGQIWQQIEPSTFSARASNPRVTIERGLIGGWLLQVEGYNRTVRVKRIR